MMGSAYQNLKMMLAWRVVGSLLNDCLNDGEIALQDIIVNEPTS